MSMDDLPFIADEFEHKSLKTFFWQFVSFTLHEKANNVVCIYKEV